MEYILLQSFTNYIDAHIIVGRLEQEGISCWLKDENSVTINPFLSNAVGGIKLMVAAAQADRARDLLLQFKTEKESRFLCPACGSGKIEQVTSVRKTSNWLMAFVTALLSAQPAVEKTWHCYNCNHEFEEPEER